MTLTVAKWWGLDPSVVDDWPNPDFLDRLEYMQVEIEIEEKLRERNERNAARR